MAVQLIVVFLIVALAVANLRSDRHCRRLEDELDRLVGRALEEELTRD